MRRHKRQMWLRRNTGGGYLPLTSNGLKKSAESTGAKCLHLTSMKCYILLNVDLDDCRECNNFLLDYVSTPLQSQRKIAAPSTYEP